MSGVNIGGPGSMPRVITAETGSEEDVQPEGKLPGGSAVKHETPETPIKDGSQPAASADKKIETRKAELKHDFDPYVSEDEEGYGEVFMDPVQNTADLELFTEDDIDQLELAALREEGLSFEDAVNTAVDSMKKESKAMQAFHKIGDMFTSAFKKFAGVFRPDHKVAQAMAKGTGQLVDVTTQGMGESEAVEVATDIAERLESKPDEVLKQMEQTPELHEVISEIKDTMRVATKNNLMRMKSMLLASAGNFPALQGMSDEAIDLMINATLSAAKLGNPGDNKTDITQLESRGYIVGIVPPAKLRLVETLLKHSPDEAIKQLEEWLPDTNFAAAMRGAERRVQDAVYSPVGGRDEVQGPWTENGGRPMRPREKVANSVEDIFEDGAVPMFEQAEAIAELNDNLKAFMAKRKNEVLKERRERANEVLKEHRERAGEHFKQTGLVVTETLLKDGIEQLRKVPAPEISRNFKLAKLAIQDHKDKFGSVAEAAASAAIARTQRLEMEADRKAAKAKLIDGHEQLRVKYNDTDGSKLTEEQLKVVTDTYTKLFKEIKGLMVTRSSKDGEGLLNRANVEANAAKLTNAVVVSSGFGVFRSADSADEIIDTLHGVRELDVNGMNETEASNAMAEQEATMVEAAISYTQLLKTGGPEALAEILKGNPVVAQALK